MPFIFQVLLTGVFLIGQFVLLFWFLPRAARDLLPRRHRHPFRRRVGPGPGAREDQGEPDLPREPGGDRGSGRLRAGRHPALRAAGYRQDAASPRRRRGRPASRSCSSIPAPSSTCSWASASSKCARCSEAAQAGAALRRRDRVLRRGRLARQPRWLAAGRDGVEPFDRSRRRTDLQRRSTYLSERRKRRCCEQHGPSRRPPPSRDGSRLLMMGGWAAAAATWALQALLAELSGLKKPRGFFNRHVRRRSACGPSRRPSTASS